MAPSEASFLEATAGSTSPSVAVRSAPAAPIRTPQGCVYPNCVAPPTRYRRGLCGHHYYVERVAGRLGLYPSKNPEHDGWVNPLVCVCEVPDADPARDAGMCQTCKRKPLALFSPGAWERHEDRLRDLALAAKRSVTR